jgi:hypothetical protein
LKFGELLNKNGGQGAGALEDVSVSDTVQRRPITIRATGKQELDALHGVRSGCGSFVLGSHVLCK